MPGRTGHAAGAGLQAKENGSDFRRRNPVAMVVTKDFPLESGNTSPVTENQVPTWFWFWFRVQDGDLFQETVDCFAPQATVALCAEVCLICVCVCVTDTRVLLLSRPPACFLAVGPTLPSPGLILSWGWKVGSLGQWLPASHGGPGARPRPSCACSYFSLCGKVCSDHGPKLLPGA